MHRAIAGAVSLIVLASAGLVGAVPGERDGTFGNAGIVTTTFGGHDDSAEALVIQPDGKIVAVGGALLGTGPDVALARYNPDGSLDPSFGTGGLVTTDFGDGSPGDHAYAVTLQPDGKIVVAGSKFGLARYNPDGSLDPSFGTGGLVVPGAFPQGNAYAVVVQPDGSIVVGGGIVAASFSPDLCGLARHFSDGTLDTSFGGDGTVVIDLGFADNRVSALILLPDGKVVAAADFPLFTLLRYETDGSLDPSFGTGGIVQTDFAAGAANRTYALLRQPDGKLVAAGFSADASFHPHVALARYDADGALDPSFGTGGLVTSLVAGTALANGVALQADGKLVTVGNDTTAGGQRMTVNRFLADGSDDASLGNGGYVATIVDGLQDIAHGVAIQPDGKVVVAGVAHGKTGVSTYFSDFGLIRYLGGECGNGVTEGGEDCDDGNLLPGDGCDASCCTADADGDGLCDSHDPCTGPVTVAKGKIILEKLDTSAGDDRLTFQGEMTVTHPFSPPLDPLANGLRLQVADAVGNVFDIVIPGGAYVGSPGVGWMANLAARKWTWNDRRTIRPGGVNKVTVQDKSLAAPGRVKFVVKGKTWSYEGLANPPLSGVMILDPPVASTGQCGRATFPGPHPVPACAPNVSGTKLICK